MWSDFESDVVEGRYPLGKLLRSEGRCGWFETKFNEKPAIASLIESLNDEAILLERLRAVEKVSDKNVAAIFATGTTTLHQTPLVYTVMEFTEENLEDVLRTRTLSAEETKEVAGALLNALKAIHKERLVCGRLEAASVLAAGDTIKLRSDYLQLVPQDSPFDSHAAKDMRELGSLLHQCLTQRPLKRATDGNDPSLQLLPPPFVQIVRRTLTGQATLDEIAAILEPETAASVSTPSEPGLVLSQAANMTPKSTTADSPVRQSDPSRKNADPAKEENPPLPGIAPQTTRRSPLLIVAIVLGLLLIAGFVLRAMLRSSSAPESQAKSNAGKPAQTAPRQLPTAAPMAAAKPKMPAATNTVALPAGDWRVVAFTYNYQDQAEHKARTINQRHPDLQAGVFSPKGGAPYLVTLGTATDRTSAFRLRDKAIQEGLPKDTYAQNYSH